MKFIANTSQIQEFVAAYIECALWSSVDDNEESFDANYTQDDIADESMASIVSDCVDFFAANLLTFNDTPDEYDVSQAGHDFWLTRCGHGAGFWDRGLGDVGEILTAASKVYGNIDPMLSDDGKIYFQ